MQDRKSRQQKTCWSIVANTLSKLKPVNLCIWTLYIFGQFQVADASANNSARLFQSSHGRKLLSSDIPLGSVSLAPGQTEGLPLDKLANVGYYVTCGFSSDGKSGQGYDDMAVSGSFNVHCILDKCNYDPTCSSSRAVRLPLNSKANLCFMGVNRSSSNLTFTNIDDTDHVNVTNCVAKVYY